MILSLPKRKRENINKGDMVEYFQEPKNNIVAVNKT